MLALIVTVEEFPVKKLNTDHSKYELRTELVSLSDNFSQLYLEQGVDNQDVEDILQRDDHTVEHGLQFGNSVDSFQRPRKREKEKEIKVFSNLFTKYLRTLSSLIAFSL